MTSGDTGIPYYVGIDGCPAGWFIVMLNQSGEWAVRVISTLRSLLPDFPGFGRILIDMPIGLRESGSEERKCDRAARSVLGRARAASVFPVPVRATLQAKTYEEAKAINRLHTGKGMTIQTWNIMPKLREVDGVLGGSTLARQRMHEAHPEVCFWALNGHKVMRYNKKTREGRREREAVLCRYLPAAPDIMTYTASCYRRSQVGWDDMLDAAVLAVTASLDNLSLSTLPSEPEHDDFGLPMEIVFPTI